MSTPGDVTYTVLAKLNVSSNAKQRSKHERVLGKRYVLTPLRMWGALLVVGPLRLRVAADVVDALGELFRSGP